MMPNDMVERTGLERPAAHRGCYATPARRRMG